jgi:hypothetical protein
VNAPLSKGARFAAIAGLLFEGVEPGLMPVPSPSVSRSLIGEANTPAPGGDWIRWAPGTTARKLDA